MALFLYPPKAHTARTIRRPQQQLVTVVPSNSNSYVTNHVPVSQASSNARKLTSFLSGNRGRTLCGYVHLQLHRVSSYQRIPPSKKKNQTTKHPFFCSLAHALLLFFSPTAAAKSQHLCSPPTSSSQTQGSSTSAAKTNSRATPNATPSSPVAKWRITSAPSVGR